MKRIIPFLATLITFAVCGLRRSRATSAVGLNAPLALPAAKLALWQEGHAASQFAPERPAATCRAEFSSADSSCVNFNCPATADRHQASFGPR